MIRNWNRIRQPCQYALDSGTNSFKCAGTCQRAIFHSSCPVTDILALCTELNREPMPLGWYQFNWRMWFQRKCSHNAIVCSLSVVVYLDFSLAPPPTFSPQLHVLWIISWTLAFLTPHAFLIVSLFPVFYVFIFFIMLLRLGLSLKLGALRLCCGLPTHTLYMH